MRITLCLLLALGASVLAEERVRRQASYTFPGPRVEGAVRQAVSYQAQQQPRNTRAYSEEPEDSNLYQPSPRRQYQPSQPVQHAPPQARSPQPQAPPPEPAYEAPRPQASPRQSYTAQSTTHRKKATSSGRANKYGGTAQEQALAGTAEEEEQQPDALSLLLEDSKFSCSEKNDGYYADDSVNCQVFHYCVSGARHSWMCPDNTVFHQVHLNCVPDSQDICSQSQKFHFVNDYLYKPLDYEGPNKTARYAQRYYPDGYVVGDPLVTHDNHAHRPQAPPPPPPPVYNRPPPPQTRSYAPPVARQPARQVAPPPPPPPPPQQAYNAPPQQSGYSSGPPAAPPSSPAGPARGSRPSRPAYQGDGPQGFRRAPRIQPPPHSVPVDDDEDDEEYERQPAPETRRPSPSIRSSAGYAPPRQQQQPPPPPQQHPQQQQQQHPQRQQQHPQRQPQPQYRQVSARTSAAARPQYPGYASNQAAGVQYDEDY